MQKNKSVFEEALLDAKRVRATAIENAKLALEESMTPKLQQMISAKLQEMEENQLDEVEDEEVEIETEETTETEEATDAKVSDLTISELTQLIKDAVSAELATSSTSNEMSDDFADDSIDSTEDTSTVEDTEIDNFEDTNTEETEVGDDEEIDLDELMNDLDSINENEEDLEEAKIKGTKLQKGSTPKSPTGFKSGKLQEKLTKELNEVNLLNAKLLYVNKIFKDNSLKESQKMNVLNRFENLKTIREVKLVYEGLKNSFKTVKPLRENLGFASKPVTTPFRKSSTIIENSAVNRMQKLAGIKK